MVTICGDCVLKTDKYDYLISNISRYIYQLIIIKFRKMILTIIMGSDYPTWKKISVELENCMPKYDF